MRFMLFKILTIDQQLAQIWNYLHGYTRTLSGIITSMNLKSFLQNLNSMLIHYLGKLIYSSKFTELGLDHWCHSI